MINVAYKAILQVIDGKLLLKVAEFGRRDFNPYDKLEVLRLASNSLREIMHYVQKTQ